MSIKKIIIQIILFCFIFNSAFAKVKFANIYIFVSFSMPKKSIENFLNDANKIGAHLVIRGLYNNSFYETTKKVLNILPDQKGGVLLDPTLFKRFHIDKVPAILITSQNCLQNKLCKNYDVIFGDVTLQYALKEIKSRSKRYDTTLNIALNKLDDK